MSIFEDYEAGVDRVQDLLKKGSTIVYAVRQGWAQIKPAYDVGVKSRNSIAANIGINSETLKKIIQQIKKDEKEGKPIADPNAISSAIKASPKSRADERIRSVIKTKPDEILTEVITSCDTEEEAQKLAILAVERKLCACAAINETKVYYAVDDAMFSGIEYRLSLTTVESRISDIIEFIKVNHSHDMPVIHAVYIKQAEGHYGEWVIDASAGNKS